jgi:hypothetical protein
VLIAATSTLLHVNPEPMVVPPSYGWIVIVDMRETVADR